MQAAMSKSTNVPNRVMRASIAFLTVLHFGRTPDTVTHAGRIAHIRYGPTSRPPRT